MLGPLFHELELHTKARGQYFTSYAISRCKAEIAVADAASARAIIDEHGFMTAMEPACGAGSMIVALADVLRGLGINYQRHLHVTAIDIDPRAVHMAYAQLSLLHIPAHLIVGNSLSGEYREHWYTPAHILGRWNGRLADTTRRPPVRAPSPPPITVPALPVSDRQGAAAATHPNVASRQLSLF
ncbi:SAM-dependent DNA methyltransferase [Sphingomonas oryzagri]